MNSTQLLEFARAVYNLMLFNKVRAIAQEWRVQAVWAVDGSFKPSDDPLMPSMSRGCVRHDGVCVRRALASDGDDSAFLAEFAAQLDVLAEEGCARVMVLFDCTSPVEALGTFVRAHDRHKADYRRDDWHSAWLRALGRFDVVIMVHAHSHKGALPNEWVDVIAKEAMSAEVHPVP